MAVGFPPENTLWPIFSTSRGARPGSPACAQSRRATHSGRARWRRRAGRPADAPRGPGPSSLQTRSPRRPLASENPEFVAIFFDSLSFRAQFRALEASVSPPLTMSRILSDALICGFAKRRIRPGTTGRRETSKNRKKSPRNPIWLTRTYPQPKKARGVGLLSPLLCQPRVPIRRGAGGRAYLQSAVDHRPPWGPVAASSLRPVSIFGPKASCSPSDGHGAANRRGTPVVKNSVLSE